MGTGLEDALGKIPVHHRAHTRAFSAVHCRQTEMPVTLNSCLWIAGGHLQDGETRQTPHREWSLDLDPERIATISPLHVAMLIVISKLRNNIAV